jgi:hypothetical protein
MDAKSLLPSRRKLSFSLIILSLVAIFVIGYNFYYIPGNRDIVHKNGFLILENIQQNIKDKNEYLQTSFKNIEWERKSGHQKNILGHLQILLNSYNVGPKIFAQPGNANYTKPSKAGAGGTDKEDSTVYLAHISNDSLFYEPANSKNRVYQIYVPAKNFMEPLFASQKKELFESYLLMSSKNGLVYLDPKLAINSDIISDSLISKNSKAMFAGIKDINVRGVDYKMFYYPFTIGAEHIQLCGFVKTDTYFNKLHEVPVSFIYPIVIALLLIIILLPIVKFYLMGKDEHIKYADFVLGIISFFSGTAILSLILIQVLLLWAAGIRTRESLENLNRQIDTDFTKELERAYVQLDSLDYVIINNPDSSPVRLMRQHKNYNVSGLAKEYFERHPGNDTLCYYNLVRAAWVDAEGDQHLKVQLDKDTPVYANVAARNYFQVLKNNGGFALPGHPGARYGLEPLNSWTNGDFNITISMKSRLGNGSIATLAAQMPSVMQTILPPGFGFCIMDNEGKVMLHSDMKRNLAENFIEKIDPSRQIKEAVKSRQESFFSNLYLYGKTHALHIKPIAASPFYLATFYDKGYVVPVNMRIFTFSLLFCFISFAICLLLWFGIFRRKYPANHFLYDPMLYMEWLVPKEKSAKFYILSMYFLVAYLLFQTILIFSVKYFEGTNYAILILVMLLPVNIFSGLFVINYRVKKDNYLNGAGQKKLSSQKALIALVLQPITVLFAYLYSTSAGYPVQSFFLFFEIFFFFFLCLFFLLPKGVLHFLYKSSFSYLTLYSMFATFLVVCLSVLPAGLYTWYAHNQEITQTLKKEQLYLANSLQLRAGQNFLFAQKRSSIKPPADYFEKLQYHTGIYKIYNDSISIDVDSGTRNKSAKSYEQFYFSVASDIGNNYYDPLLIPALRDSASGNAWYWSKESDTLPSSREKKSLSFWYNLYSTLNTDTVLPGMAEKSLKITSAFPERYVFVVKSFRGIMLLLLVAGFIYGLYLLLRFISGQLFLRNFIPYIQDNNIEEINGVQLWFEKYRISNEVKGISTGLVNAADVTKLIEEYDFFKPVPDSKILYMQDRQMIALQDKYRDFYFFIWNACEPKEKYMLLDFAENGFINFKNTEVIHHLFQKGIFIEINEEVKVFSASFRSFILSQKLSKEMISLHKELKQDSAWQTIRIPLLISLLGVSFFIFFTQEQTFQKITALVAGISTLISMMLKFFTDGSGFFSAKK